MMRQISLNELDGFREALLELAVKVDLGTDETIDLCGTGGDGKNTFNISTLASLVVAGAGIPVTKHGNYGVSSVSGSSNVLEFFGVKFSNESDFLSKCLDQTNICILHAPLFHPAMKNVAAIRKDLGLKTIFNMLGPLINPVQPKNQLVGVFSLELMRMYGYLFQNSKKNYCILHSLSGHDEISLTTDCKYVANQKEGLISPIDFGLNKVTDQQIFGGNSIEEAAKIFENIISGKGTNAQNNVVCANAGMAISLVKNCNIKEGFEIANESLLSGAAKKSFTQLLELSK